MGKLVQEVNGESRYIAEKSANARTATLRSCDRILEILKRELTLKCHWLFLAVLDAFDLRYQGSANCNRFSMISEKNLDEPRESNPAQVCAKQ